ncbi:MAG: hypothetical protein EBU33_09850, partial [Sphingobacteriia bacterium]|nr:hypothetical protein [Sphingobacteriia bacterium]
SRAQQIENTKKAIEDYIKTVKKANEIKLNEVSAKSQDDEIKAAGLAYQIRIKDAKKAGEDITKIKSDYEAELLMITQKYSKLENLDKKTAREKDLDDAKMAYTELLKNAEKFKLDTTKLEEAYNLKVIQINQKYAVDLNKQIAEYVKTSEDLRKEARKKELDDAKIAYDNLIKEAERLGIDTTKLTESYNSRVADINKKYDADEVKSKEEFNEKVKAIKTAATADEVERSRKEREDKYTKDLADLEADKNFIKLSEDDKGNLRVLLKQAYTNDIKKIDDDARKDDNDKLLKKYDDELRLLELRGQNLLVGTKTYFENRAAILAEEEAKELAALDLSEAERTAIKEKYSKLRQQLDEDELASTGKVISATIDAVAGLTNA